MTIESADLGKVLGRAFPIGPTAALLVPEAELVALVLAAREVAFFPFDDLGEINTPLSLLDDLDRTSEPFADMLDLPLTESTERRTMIVAAALHVRAWLDAGCITLPPIHDIRSLVEALK